MQCKCQPPHDVTPVHCAHCAVQSCTIHQKNSTVQTGTPPQYYTSTPAVPYSATIGLSTILQSRVNNGTRPELYSANGKCSAVQSVQFCIHQNSELNWSLHNITEPHSANGNSSTMLQSEEWYRTSANGNSSTMGLELCGRGDKGSIWGPAVLACCNATLKYQ